MKCVAIRRAKSKPEKLFPMIRTSCGISQVVFGFLSHTLAYMSFERIRRSVPFRVKLPPLEAPKVLDIGQEGLCVMAGTVTDGIVTFYLNLRRARNRRRFDNPRLV